MDNFEYMRSQCGVKRVLIIRSVSFQQLDKSLVAVRQRFPGAELHLLTHSHGLEQAAGYKDIVRVIDYGSRKNFSSHHIPSSLAGGVSYDAIIVPVTNITGVGFLNVLGVAFRIDSKQVFICNLVSDFREVPRRSIVFLNVRASLLTVLATFFTIPFFIIMLPVLSIMFIFQGLGKRSKKKVGEKE